MMVSKFSFLGKLFLQQIFIKLNANVATVVEKVLVNEQCKLLSSGRVWVDVRKSSEHVIMGDAETSDAVSYCLHAQIHDVNKYILCVLQVLWTQDL